MAKNLRNALIEALPAFLRKVLTMINAAIEIGYITHGLVH